MYTLEGLETYGFEEELFFDYSQMVALFFQADGASQMRTCTIQNSNQIKQKQKTFNQNYFEERVAWKKSPQTFLTQELLKKKEKINKRFTGKSWKQFTFEPCYTCEKTSQLSYKSRVLHSIWLCVLAGIYTRGGAPAILTILLIYIHLSTKNM